jgi:hypothetical protein
MAVYFAPEFVGRDRNFGDKISGLMNIINDRRGNKSCMPMPMPMPMPTRWMLVELPFAESANGQILYVLPDSETKITVVPKKRNGVVLDHS